MLEQIYFFDQLFDSILLAGADLKYCKTNTLQCCDNAYFMKRKALILNSVTKDIQEQIENQVENLDHIVDGVEKGIYL